MFTGYQSSSKPSINEVGFGAREAVQQRVKNAVDTLISTVFLEKKDAEQYADLRLRLEGLVLQSVLLSDAKMQSEQNLFGEKYAEVLEKREKLQKKWGKMDDSDEKRDIFSIVFADFSQLSKVDIAILSDNISAYEEHGWEQGKYWGRDLNLAALLGSREIGEFIIKEKKDFLTEEDHERVLGYISGSFNNDWAIDFAKKMKDGGMSMPSSVDFFCEDFNLAQSIEESFLDKKTARP